MNNEKLMATVSKHADFLDDLEKDLRVCIVEDERDALKITDGSGAILEGRAEMGRQILNRLEIFRQYLSNDFYKLRSKQ
jgi:hypothetical protein